MPRFGEGSGSGESNSNSIQLTHRYDVLNSDQEDQVTFLFPWNGILSYGDSQTTRDLVASNLLDNSSSGYGSDSPNSNSARSSSGSSSGSSSARGVTAPGGGVGRGGGVATPAFWDRPAFHIFFSLWVLVVTVGVQAAMVFYSLTYPTTWTTLNLPNVDISLDAFQIPNHITSLHEDALLAALKDRQSGSLDNGMADWSGGGGGYFDQRSYAAGGRGGRAKRFSYPPQHTSSWTLEIVYVAQGGDDADNIFTPERLEAIHQIETDIMQVPGFSDYCSRSYEENLRQDSSLARVNYCLPINSLLTYFYPSKVNGQLFFDGLGSEQAEIPGTLRKAMTHKQFYWYVDDGMTAKNQKSKLLRSEVQFGYEYMATEEERTITHEEFQKFIVKYVSMLDKASTDKVRVLYGGTIIFDWEVLQTFYHDEKLAIISLILIAVLVLILTSFSLWLTFWALFSIILSFGLAYVFYHNVFGSQSFGILNGVSAFVVIGIGVDDVFVFVNTFRQARHIKRLSTRVLYTLFTAGKATLFTSFTTTAAFAANMLSQIPAIYDFGLFMTLLVSCCWVNVVLLMPAALVLWHYAFFPCENLFSSSISKLFWCRKKVAPELENLLTSYEQPIQNDCTTIDPAEDATNSTAAGASSEGNNSNDDVPLLDLQNDDVQLLGLESNNEAALLSDGDVPLIQLETLSERGSGSSRSSSLRSSVTHGKKAQGFINIMSFMRKLMCKYIAYPMILGRYIVIGGYFVVLLGCLLAIAFLYKPASKPVALYRPDSNLQQLFDMAFNFSSDDISCKRCSGIYLEGSQTLTDWEGPDQTPGAGPINILSPFSKLPQLPTTTSTARPLLLHSTSKSNPFPAATTRRNAVTVLQQGTPARSSAPQTSAHNSGGEEPPQFTGDTVYVVFGIHSDDITAGRQLLTDASDGTLQNGNFDTDFDLSTSVASLCQICKNIAARKDLVREGGAHCYKKEMMSYFKWYQECNNLPPLPEGESKSDYRYVPEASPGNSYYAMAFELVSDGMSKAEAYDKWENLIKEEKRAFPDTGLSSMFETCDCWASQAPGPGPPPPKTPAAPQGGGGEEFLPTVQSVDKGYDPCLDGSCGQAVNRPILHNGAQVFVVFGIKTIDRSNLTGKHVLDDNLGKVVYDDNFKMTAQTFTELCQMCKNIYSRRDLVKEGGAQCYPLSMKPFLDKLPYPECHDLPEPQLLEGVDSMSIAGFKEDRTTLLWYALAFESTTNEGSSASQAYQDYMAWENLMEEERGKLSADSSLRSAYQTCDYWKQIFMELLGVSSAIYGLAFSLILCTFAAVVFTTHLVLLLIVMLTIVGVISSVVALFFVFGWELGAVEAISLAILVGSSVDYCMHLVEGYLIAGHNLPNNLTDAKLRQWRAKAAFGHIGVSIVSSALTTIVAAIPLCFATILPFAKFGGIVALNTTLSIVYTLTATTAFLSAFAPARYVCSIKWFLISVATILALLGLLVLGAYCVYLYGHTSIPGPDGNSLF